MRQYPRKKIHLPISIKRDPSQDPITFDQTTFFHSFFPENRSIEGDWNNPCCQKNKRRAPSRLFTNYWKQLQVEIYIFKSIERLISFQS